MKRVLIVSIITFSAIMFVSYAALSAEIAPIGISKVKRTDLADVIRVFNKTAGQYDDAYAIAEKISKKNKNQTWVSVIEQARRTDVVDSITSTQITDLTIASLESEVAAIIDNADYIGFNATKREIAEMKFLITNALRSALDNNTDLRVYSGSYTGCYDTDFSFIAIIDSKHNQMVTLAGGYDE